MNPAKVAAATAERQQREAQLAAARREVIARYARLKPAGRHAGEPEFCKPTRAEKDGRVPAEPGSTDKPIYPTREAAEAAARDLEKLGSWPMRAYPCPRSRSGHHHLGPDRPGPPRPGEPGAGDGQ